MTPFSYGCVLAVIVAACGGLRAARAGEDQPSPEAALKRLRDGNARFRADKPAARELSMKKRVQLAMEQRPFAIVLTCADSRVSPELVFDQGLGDLFVLRVAGNITEPGVVGSIEYAVLHLRCPLIVVLGHEGCGAVKAAMNIDEVHGNLGALIEQVRVGKNLPADPKAGLSAAVKTNTLHHARELTYKSVVLRDFTATGRTRVLAGVYDLAGGAVTWLELPAAKGPSVRGAAKKEK
jgi:carbonic anhydrase